MGYVRNLVESNYTFPGDGNRMPLYPLLQSLFYDADQSDEALFTRGKYVNLGLSMILLTGIFLIIRRRLKWYLTLNFMLIAAFTVFIFKAPFILAELLFYFLSFVLFFLMLLLFIKPSILLAVSTGVLAGLTYLTKASVPPGLLLFLFFISIKALYQLFRQHQSMPIKQAYFAVRPLLMVIPLVAIFFLITVSIQLRNNKQTFGHYFYNVNSTFYMWYDSWEEAKQGTRAHGDRVGWPEMPPEDIPSLQKYLREHTPTQILKRFVSGVWSIVWNMNQSYGYLNYVLIYTVLFCLAALARWSQTKQLIRSYPFMILFVLAYFSAYFLLYAWYAPIAAGNRFVLALVIPLLFVLFSCLQIFSFPKIQVMQRFRWDWLMIANLFVLAILTVDIYLILTNRIVTVYGGS